MKKHPIHVFFLHRELISAGNQYTAPDLTRSLRPEMCYLGEEKKGDCEQLFGPTLDVCTDLYFDLFGTCHEIRNFVDTMP